MIIYRIQTDDGQGPMLTPWKLEYPKNLEYIRSDPLPDGSERREHPDADAGTALAQAYWDKKIYTGGPLRFGFASIKHLDIWYSPVDIGWREANGFYIHIFDIPNDKVIHGTRQVCFDPSDAVSVRKVGFRGLRRLRT